MKPRQLTIQGVANHYGMEPGEIAVDLFAGGGGWSEGEQEATGASPAEAVNHDPASIAMHAANHPNTRHHCTDLLSTNIDDVVQGRRIGHLHGSPDCTYHSVARGGKPMRDKQIRVLPWVMIRWMAKCRPRVVTIENVREFVKWGPLRKKRDANGKLMLDKKGGVQWEPDPRRRGQTFKQWIQHMRDLGYNQVDHTALNAADYGAPTNRRRFYLIARSDGITTPWPEPTHGPGRKLPHRTTAECIDWSIPCPSIFDPAERRRHGCKPVLAENTLRRIAEGIRRFVLEDPAPFIVRIGQAGGNGAYSQDLARPLSTITTKAEHCLVTPHVVRCAHGETGKDGRSRRGKGSQSVRDPLPTVTGSNDFALAAVHLTKLNQNSIGKDARKPLDTVMAGAQRFGVVSAFLAKHNGGATGHSLRQPIDTIAGNVNKALVTALVVGCGGRAGQSSPTSVGDPLGTITGKGDKCMVAAHLTKMYGTSTGQGLGEPAPTTTGKGNHTGLVAAFLTKYNRTGKGQRADQPLATITSIERLGLVTVEIDGQTYAIADIGMRMLSPRELARCQGFPDSYILTGTKRDQVARIGNSVCPQVAAAIVRACFPVAAKKRKAGAA